VRIVIVAGPSRGKSTLAHELHCKHGWPVFCADPASKVVFQKPYTTYLPESLDFAGDNGAAAWVAEHWLSMPGPWVVEGHALARALRRWMQAAEADGWGRRQAPHYPCDRIIVLDREAHRETTRHQEAMHAGVMKVWYEISDYFAPITEWRE
jgi:hypothetical protein